MKRFFRFFAPRHHADGGDIHFYTRERAAASLYSTGNTARLHRAFKKAESGEQVTIAYIGGSITEGISAIPRETNCYAALSARNFAEKYMADPGRLNFVNAGVSATTSELGVIRCTRDVLQKRPDIIFVEFAANDSDDIRFKCTYESLIRKFLQWEGEAAVILLFAFGNDGYSRQDWMKQIGKHYDLGMVSIRDGLYPDIQAGLVRWEDYSDDTVHPNMAGHRFIAGLIGNYYEQAKKMPAALWQMPETPLFGNLLEDIVNIGPGHPFIISEGDFPYSPAQSGGYRMGWRHEGGSNAPMKLRVPGRRIAFAFQYSSDPRVGTAEVWAEGERKIGLESYSPSGAWGQPATYTVELGAGVHDIEIRMAPGHEDKYFVIPDMGYVE